MPQRGQRARDAHHDARHRCHAGGGFGCELDLLKLPERACEHIRNQVKRYHEVEDLVREGLFYRLSSPLTDAVCAWE